MTALRLFMIAALLGALGISLAEDAPKLEPWVHTYHWEEFALTQEAPTSADGRYRLKSVSKTGDVELYYSPTPERREVVVVKPMPKQFKKGDRPPTMVVKTFDASKQSVILRELRIK
jgi:hypothetical protein